jgi:hypothetical protein
MAGKRELSTLALTNDTCGGKESDDLGLSLARDVRRKAKTVVKAGYGDRGIGPSCVTVRDEAITVHSLRPSRSCGVAGQCRKRAKSLPHDDLAALKQCLKPTQAARFWQGILTFPQSPSR